MPTETLHFESPQVAYELYGSDEENLDLIEAAFDVLVAADENGLKVEGTQAGIENVRKLFEMLMHARTQGIHLKSKDFQITLEAAKRGDEEELTELFENPLVVRVGNKTVVPRTLNQKRYLHFIKKHEVVFGIGPAGTGKTYLAVLSAVQALLEGKVEKIILSRPAVEAGEALGFLPGDLTEKIEPYLRPLHDAMNDLIGPGETQHWMEKGTVEIAPLAYMRGRTLSNAYVLLDEAQNTTREQMMMFLTRLGENSRMIITGDITQVDLPKAKSSGLRHAVEVLQQVKGIKLFHFNGSDVVRHPLVGRIIRAYEAHQNQ